MAGSISAQASANIIVWARSIGINDERITDIFNDSVNSPGEDIWTVDASPTSDATLYATLQPFFVGKGLYDEKCSQFIAAMHAIGPDDQLLNVA